MPNIKANNINIEFDTFGSESKPPLLMVMGLGAQMIAWDVEFCELLADQGHFVIRYDNRDVGLSTHFNEHAAPSMEALVAELLAGNQPDVPYTVNDMAADGMGLLAELGIDKAHICGASMGGMIVQAMAINHPERVLSMTSIMSTTGNPELPPATPEAQAALTSPPATSREEAGERAFRNSKVIGSSGFPVDEERVRSPRH